MNRYFYLIVTVILLFLLSACGGGPSASRQWTGQHVVDGLKAAGLEAESTRPMAQEEYSLAPMMTTEGIRFFIPSLGEDRGGRILIFDDVEKRDTTRDFYVKAGEQNALIFSWVYVKDNVVVQINGDLPEDQAKKYETALQSLK